MCSRRMYMDRLQPLINGCNVNDDGRPHSKGGYFLIRLVVLLILLSAGYSKSLARETSSISNKDVNFYVFWQSSREEAIARSVEGMLSRSSTRNSSKFHIIEDLNDPNLNLAIRYVFPPDEIVDLRPFESPMKFDPAPKPGQFLHVKLKFADSRPTLHYVLVALPTQNMNPDCVSAMTLPYVLNFDFFGEIERARTSFMGDLSLCDK